MKVVSIKSMAVIYVLFVTVLLKACGSSSGGGGGGDSAPVGNTDTAITFKITAGGGDYDSGSAVLQTLDGEYIIVGTTAGTAFSDEINDDIYLIKMDAKGEVKWERIFGSAGNESGESVFQTSDGGFIIAGSTISIANSQDVYLVKTDKNGEKEWENHYGGTADEEGKSVQQTTDGGYIIAGSTTSFGKGGDVYLVKIKPNTNGEMQWNGYYGGDGIDWGESVHQTLDGGYIIAGHTSSYGSGPGDIYLIKTDANGNETWPTPHVFGGNEHDFGESVQQTTDGGFIITGRKSIDPANGDVYLIKTDADGNELWNNNFGGPGSDHGYAVSQTTDGGYIIAGVIAIEKGPDVYQFDICLIKTDANGNEIWPAPHTFGGVNNDLGLSVVQTRDGGYIITGSTNNGSNYDVYVIKTDMYGNTK
jgi:hypothetical protein